MHQWRWAIRKKKATGLGITEFMLRYMAWLYLKDEILKGSQMCIVTGPRIDVAITLIGRIKKLLYEKIGVIFDYTDNCNQSKWCMNRSIPISPPRCNERLA
jgi:late competence protein required for DNA uptake (superfamily II DNA/RNA helicase)